MTAFLIAVMVVVIVGFFALALTDSPKMRTSKPSSRTAAAFFWLGIVIVGWLGFAYVVLVVAGDPQEAWAWVQAQLSLMNIAMWAFLLPWMGALRILQTSWAEWLQLLAVGGLALLTVGLALAQFGRR